MIVNKPKKKKRISRYTVLNIIMGIIFSVIICKLVYIQVYKHADYQEKADISSTRFISQKAPRGKIYDSQGNILATNIQTYVLTYTQTDESQKNFYETMDSTMKILSENGEKVQDDLLLKIDSNGKFYFDFKTNDPATRKSVELRFKRDRGLNEAVQKRLFKDKKGDLTDSELEKINEELLKISPEDTFYELVKIYDMYELLKHDPNLSEEEKKFTKDEIQSFIDMSAKDMTNLVLEKYTTSEIRRYMVIKDSIKMQSFKGYRAVTIASNIKKDTAFIIYQKLNDLPGIDVSLEPIRYYPYNNLASSSLGYLSPIDSSKEENYKLRGYEVSSDIIGVAGIEAAFEDQLKGVKGGSTVKVNSKGRVTEELFKLDSYPGNNVHLTIDKNVQYAAEQGMKDTIERIRTQEGQPGATRGSVVAIEVNTGRVLAIVSYPDYDPNLFSVPGKLSPEDSKKYFNPDLETFGKEYISKTHAGGSLDELFPKDDETGLRTDRFDVYPRNFFNYATQGLLPPGSTFKPLSAISGLMEGVITQYESMNDTAGIWKTEELSNLTLENFKRIPNGPTDVRKALEVSSNYFFYELGYRMYKNNGGNIKSLDSLAKYVWKFGLGVDPNSSQAKKPSTGIEIEENFGQTYNFESWKKQIVEEPMYTLVSDLEAGAYRFYSFVPFDISKNDEDSDELKEAKISLKSKITETLSKVGTSEQVKDTNTFLQYILEDVKKIMNISPKYKANVESRESSSGKKVDINDQAEVVAEAIADYTISSKATEIISPAQIVYDAIGQGMNRFTPVQLANYVATLGSGGTRYKVRLVDKITSPTGEVIQEFKPEVVDKLDIPEEYLNAVKDGMYRVNTSPANGVAYQCFANFPIKVGGKTGTADFGTEEQYNFQGRRPYGNYISMAPLDNPKIAIFSTIYDGNKGSSDATIHKAIYEAYFKDELLKKDPNYGSKSESFRKYVLESPLKDNKETTIKE
ncbi:penicillin-binding transpeptidase domain-containing protein [Clostridium carnis]